MSGKIDRVCDRRPYRTAMRNRNNITAQMSPRTPIQCGADPLAQL
jgi:hypothetical protein